MKKTPDISLWPPHARPCMNTHTQISIFYQTTVIKHLGVLGMRLGV